MNEIGNVIKLGGSYVVGICNVQFQCFLKNASFNSPFSLLGRMSLQLSLGDVDGRLRFLCLSLDSLVTNYLLLVCIRVALEEWTLDRGDQLTITSIRGTLVRSVESVGRYGITEVYVYFTSVGGLEISNFHIFLEK